MSISYIPSASRYHSPPVKQRAVRKDKNSGRSHPLYLESKELPHGSFHAWKAPESPPGVSEACKYNYVVWLTIGWLSQQCNRIHRFLCNNHHRFFIWHTLKIVQESQTYFQNLRESSDFSEIFSNFLDTFKESHKTGFTEPSAWTPSSTSAWWSPLECSPCPPYGSTQVDAVWANLMHLNECLRKL